MIIKLFLKIVTTFKVYISVTKNIPNPQENNEE